MLPFFPRGLINLQKVYLRNCSIGSLNSTAFEGLFILIEVDLSHNEIRSLSPGTFHGNVRIRKLWLGHNPLRSLHGYTFPSIPHLARTKQTRRRTRCHERGRSDRV